jgi:hypothetical protein
MPALDRTPCDLMALPAAEALECVAVWLDDCDTHLATRAPGGLPCPPFNLFDAAVVVLSAKLTREALDAALRRRTAAPQSVALLAHQEWFDRGGRDL